MKIDRKSVKRNLMNLIEFGYDIEYSASIRLVKDKNGEKLETKILSDFYLNRSFTDGELRLLIDSVLFSNHISYSQCRDLVEKLEGLSNIYFRSRVKHIRNLPENQPSNSELFMTIETLDKAISRGLQVSFTYNSYDMIRSCIHAGQAIMKYETTLLIRIRLLLQTADTILSATMRSTTIFRTIASTESQISSFSTHLQSRREWLRELKTDLTCQSTSLSICICLQAKA